MEIKNWSYEEFPAFSESVEGAVSIETTGDEVGVHYIHDEEYAHIDGVALHLQILQPYSRNQPEKCCPCVVYVQGSAWKKQNPYRVLPQLSKLAERGYVVAVVEYRHSGIAAFPAQAIDAGNAVRFLRKHACNYHINPEQFFLAGDSSGGHTALFAALRKDDETKENLYPGISSAVRGVISLYGSCSFMRQDCNPSTLNYKLPDSPEGKVMGGANLRDNLDLCKSLSVECHIQKETDMPPALLIHGTKDRTVNTRCSVDLYRKMKECQKEVSLYLIEGADHGGAEFWSPEVLSVMEQFIGKCLKG